MEKRTQIKKIVKFFALFLVTVFCFTAKADITGAATTSMKIHALNLDKHGDCVLLESNGSYLIMDLGDYDSYKTSIKPYLKGLGIKHVSLYYSHFDPDHTGGLGQDGHYGIDDLMNDFTVDTVYIPDASVSPEGNIAEYSERLSNHYADKYGEAQAAHNIKKLKVGSTFSVGSARCSVIGPVDVNKLSKTAVSEDGDKDNYANNCSLVTKVTCGKTTYLTTGDCKDEQESLLVKKYGTSLKADIYKMAHHGMVPANSEKFISYVQPLYSFAQNAGVTENVPYLDGSKKHRRTYPARYACSQYGFCYMVGDEKKALVIDVKNDKINLYRQGSSKALNSAGWTKVYGSDGVYEKYDYYYFGNNGKPLTGVQKIDGKIYYLGTGGCREAGTYEVKKRKKVYKCWRYYTDKNGKTLRRYFAENTDEMYQGICKIDKNYYYFEPTGILRLGDSKATRQKINGKYYALYPSGAFCTNTWHKYSKGFCYFDKKGRMLTRWQTINRKKYYLDPKTGYRVTGVRKIDENIYRFSPYGQLYTNRWDQDGSNSRYLGKNGAAVKGWMNYAGYRYYLDPETGFRTVGIRQIGNKVYSFSPYGRLLTNTSVKVGKKSYKINAKGELTGVPKVAGTSITRLSTRSSKVTVQWKKNKKADGYVIYYSTNLKTGYKAAVTTKNNRTVSTTIKKLKKGKKYYIKIVSYKNFGSSKIYSKDSAVKMIKVK